MATLLDVRDLRTEFHTRDGIVHAINGVNLALEEGETLGIVGESGCGKSVTMLSLLQLIPRPPGKIVSGTALLNGNDLLGCEVRGHAGKAADVHEHHADEGAGDKEAESGDVHSTSVQRRCEYGCGYQVVRSLSAGV